MVKSKHGTYLTKPLWDGTNKLDISPSDPDASKEPRVKNQKQIGLYKTITTNTPMTRAWQYIKMSRQPTPRFHIRFCNPRAFQDDLLQTQAALHLNHLSKPVGYQAL